MKPRVPCKAFRAHVDVSHRGSHRGMAHGRLDLGRGILHRLSEAPFPRCETDRLKLTDDERHALEMLRKRHGFATLSDALRSCIPTIQLRPSAADERGKKR